MSASTISGRFSGLVPSPAMPIAPARVALALVAAGLAIAACGDDERADVRRLSFIISARCTGSVSTRTSRHSCPRALRKFFAATQ